MGEKRYYWLKLPEDFFRDKAIKRLRQIAGGDTYTIIYLKMLLSSMRDGGKLIYEGFEETFAREIALELDEDSDNVQMTMNYLQKVGLLLEGNDEATLTQLPSMVGSEGTSAQRQRMSRAKRKALCDNVTDMSHQCHTEIDIDIEKEKDKEKRKRFVPPSVEDVQAYCIERNNNVDPIKFVDYYSSNGWMVGKNKMKDWKASVRTWERSSFNRQKGDRYGDLDNIQWD